MPTSVAASGSRTCAADLRPNTSARGSPDLDASVLQSGLSRRITQLVSRVAYEQRYPGIGCRSRYSHELENWALFEPFRLEDAPPSPWISTARLCGMHYAYWG